MKLQQTTAFVGTGEQSKPQSLMKKALSKMFHSAYELNLANIISLLDQNNYASLLDVGCNDGIWTMDLAKKLGTKSIFGVEIVEDRAELARSLGIDVALHDASVSLPYQDDSFDVVHANQVIEHVPDIDRFVSEIHRILKPGGYVVISTENASSWHNIFAMSMGWQMFSLTNLSQKSLGTGNPFALHRACSGHLSSWTHKVIFSFRGLREFLENHGLKVTAVKGAGYYPLPASTGLIDPRHAHFLTVRATKT